MTAYTLHRQQGAFSIMAIVREGRQRITGQTVAMWAGRDVLLLGPKMRAHRANCYGRFETLAGAAAVLGQIMRVRDEYRAPLKEAKRTLSELRGRQHADTVEILRGLAWKN